MSISDLLMRRFREWGERHDRLPLGVRRRAVVEFGLLVLIENNCTWYPNRINPALSVNYFPMANDNHHIHAILILNCYSEKFYSLRYSNKKWI